MPTDSNKHELKQKVGYCYCSFMARAVYSHLLGIRDTEGEQDRWDPWLKKFTVLDLASLESQFLEGETLYLRNPYFRI